MVMMLLLLLFRLCLRLPLLVGDRPFLFLPTAASACLAPLSSAEGS
ncbi:hypothetical protein N9L68_02480 [bacterium]|nr:hypothetical protein [bacterium]